MQETLIEVNNLSSWYDENKHVIENASFSISKNEILAFVGVNGAGKTTLINTLTSIHSGYSLDSFAFNGAKANFTDEKFKLSRIAVFSQDESFRYWSFDENIRFMYKTYNIVPDAEYMNYLIEGFNFRQYTSYMKKDLSLGNKKKYALIAAFCLRLPLLILDEPVDGLDFEATAFLYKVIKEYKSYGSVLMSTHVVESINESCDSYVVLKGGKLLPKETIRAKMSVPAFLHAVKG